MFERRPPGKEEPARASGADDDFVPASRTRASAAAQIASVETLLDALRDMVSSLASMNRQLGREVMTILQQQIEAGQAARDEKVETLRKENAQLREAIQGRALIERAKGILMASHRCDEETAFQTLVTLSRQQRRKVRDVAAEIATAAPSGDAASPRSRSDPALPGPLPGGRPGGVTG